MKIDFSNELIMILLIPYEIEIELLETRFLLILQCFLSITTYYNIIQQHLAR